MRIIETNNFKIASTRGWNSDEVQRLRQFILFKLGDGHALATSEIAREWQPQPGGVSRVTAINTILNQLIQEGLVERMGQGMGWKYFLARNKTASATLPATPENIARAKAFVLSKWKARAAEFGRPEPKNLSGACKFASLFAQRIFGGKLTGNASHQYVLLPNGQPLDLTDSTGLSMKHDRFFWNNREHKESLKSCQPRVDQWVQEFSGNKTASRRDSGRVELGGHEYTITSDGERHELDPFNRLSEKEKIMNRLYQPFRPPKKPKPENSAQEGNSELV